jgi:hypothetical protein
MIYRIILTELQKDPETTEAAWRIECRRSFNFIFDECLESLTIDSKIELADTDYYDNQ